MSKYHRHQLYCHRHHQGFAELMRMTTSVTSTGTKEKIPEAVPAPGLQNTKHKHRTKIPTQNTKHKDHQFEQRKI